ncbi:MAG: hypothetical protein RLZZ292_3589 [Bacteroidota bacterium]|jgi:hypothetical protein
MTEPKLTILEQDILSDIKERQDMMLQTKTMYLRYGFTDVDEAFFLNYSIPIIYSIWEGFIQSSFQTYVREINRLNLPMSQVCKPILVYTTESKFKQFKQYPEVTVLKFKFFDDLKQFYQTNRFDINPAVNTESNVGFKVLNRIMSQFNLDEIPKYPELKYSLEEELDNFLLKIRNSVAHGNNAITVGRNDLDRAIKLVEMLMDLVFEKIKKGFLIDKSYLLH